MIPWVFLRGLTRESGHWGDFPAVFQAELGGAGVHLVDLPGNGCQHRLKSPPRIEAMAEFCRRELGRRHLLPPYRLLALSLGGLVAVAWARQYPGEIQGCVLINASLGSLSPFHHRLRPGSYWPLLQLALAGRQGRRREEIILQLTSVDPQGRASVLAPWSALAAARPVGPANALRQLFAAWRFRAPAPGPAVPVLLLAGRRDALVDCRCSRALAAAWDCPLAEHPRAGHDLPLDDGPWVARRVGEWLAGRPLLGEGP